MIPLLILGYLLCGVAACIIAARHDGELTLFLFVALLTAWPLGLWILLLLSLLYLVEQSNTIYVYKRKGKK